MGKNYLITIKESERRLFNGICDGIKNNKKHGSHSVSFLMASLLNEVVSSYSDEIISLKDGLEGLEDQLLDLTEHPQFHSCEDSIRFQTED